MIFPSDNLPTAAKPWGREITKQLSNVIDARISDQINNTARDNQLNSSILAAEAIALNAQNTADAVTAIVNNIYVDGTTELDGAVMASGTLSASKITTGTLNAGLITAGTLSGDRINGGTITGSTITGGSLSTSGTQHVKVQGTAVYFYNDTGALNGTLTAGYSSAFSEYGIILSLSSTPGDVTMPNFLLTSHYIQMTTGTSIINIDSSTNLMKLASLDIELNAIGGSITLTSNSVTVNAPAIYLPSITSTTSASNFYYSTANKRIYYSTASSARFKENIQDILSAPSIDPHKLLDLPVRAFSYKTDYLDNEDDPRYQTLIPGFIAEEVDSIYPIGADYDDGVPYSWNERMIVPGLLSLIQELYKRVEILEGK